MQTDDLSDEGELQSQPDRVKASIDTCRETLSNPDLPTPTYPYAAMLQEWVLQVNDQLLLN